jgi:hypothetical protein
MVLHIQANYPQGRTYVLKLHRDCAPLEGQIAGRLEHIASAHSVQFSSAEELIAALTSNIFPTDEQAQESAP